MLLSLPHAKLSGARVRETETLKPIGRSKSSDERKEDESEETLPKKSIKATGIQLRYVISFLRFGETRVCHKRRAKRER